MQLAQITLFNPLFWITLITALSFIIKKSKWRKILRYSGFTLFLLLTNTWLSNRVLNLWEYETIGKKDISEPYDIGIVLGPFLYHGIEYPIGKELVRGEHVRLFIAIQLYKEGKIKKILLSGNNNTVLTQQHLLALEIPSDDILIEGQSKNTYENAFLSERVLSENKISTNTILLITSASHMRRAKKCFEKVGLNITPFSVDYWTRHTVTKLSTKSSNRIITFTSVLRMCVPSITALRRWDILFREWASMLLFKLKYSI